MTEISIMGIDRKSSIESEPRTLNFRQIQSARDAALYVFSTRTIEEASQIFTEGMEPVPRMLGRESGTSSAGEFEEGEEGTYPSYRCKHQQLNQEALRDVLTAPF